VSERFFSTRFECGFTIFPTRFECRFFQSVSKELAYVRRQLALRLKNQKDEALKIITNSKRKPTYPFKKIEILIRTDSKFNEFTEFQKSDFSVENSSKKQISDEPYVPKAERVARELGSRASGGGVGSGYF
jgi:hypothetical protein